jgi:hypothetical protein
VSTPTHALDDRPAYERATGAMRTYSSVSAPRFAAQIAATAGPFLPRPLVERSGQRHWKRQLHDTVPLRSSIQIRVVNLSVMPSLERSRSTTSESLWMEKGAGETTYSWSDSGAA